MTEKTYSERVYDLAWLLCDDNPNMRSENIDLKAHKLALKIQSTVDDFFLDPVGRLITFGPPTP